MKKLLIILLLIPSSVLAARWPWFNRRQTRPVQTRPIVPRPVEPEPENKPEKKEDKIPPQFLIWREYDRKNII